MSFARSPHPHCLACGASLLLALCLGGCRDSDGGGDRPPGARATPDDTSTPPETVVDDTGDTGVSAQLTWDGPPLLLAGGTSFDQHHATVAMAPDHRSFLACSLGPWVVAIPYAAPDAPAPDAVPVSVPSVAHHPQTVVSADRFMVVAGSPAGLSGRVYGLDGGALTEGGPLLPEAGADRFPDLAVQDDGSGLIVWSNPGVVRAATFTGLLEDLTELDPIAQVSDDTSTVSVASWPGGYAVAWTEGTADEVVALVRRFDADVQPLGPPLEVARLPRAGDAPRPELAAGEDGSLVVAWRHGQHESDAQAWVRVYDPVDDIVAEHTLHDLEPARRPVVAIAGGVAAVAWEAGPLTRVRMRLLDVASGVALTSSIDVSVEPSEVHSRADLALQQDGEGVVGLVSWESQAPWGGRHDVRSRSFTWQ